jgi:hypothetical protein
MARLNPIERRLERFLREPPSVRNAAAVIVIATAVIVVGAGVVISLLERKLDALARTSGNRVP